jgi:methyl-accepting chemotaxis protein
MHQNTDSMRNVSTISERVDLTINQTVLAMEKTNALTTQSVTNSHTIAHHINDMLSQINTLGSITAANDTSMQKLSAIVQAIASSANALDAQLGQFKTH